MKVVKIIIVIIVIMTTQLVYEPSTNTNDVDELIKLLSSADIKVKTDAIIKLERMGKDAAKALPELIKLLDDTASIDKKYWYSYSDGPSGSVAATAARALGMIRDSGAVEPLIKLLNSNDKDIKKAAADALASIGDKRAVEPLIKMLNDDDHDVRRSAVNTLNSFKDPRVIKPYISSLKDGWSRWEISEGLVSLGEPAVEPLIAALDTYAGKNAPDRNSRYYEIRGSIVSALAKIKDRRAVDALIKRLGDRNEVASVSWALAEIGDPRAIEPIIKLF